MTREIAIPYDKGCQLLHIREDNLAAVLTPRKEAENALSEAEIVSSSLDNPIASPPLEELAAGKKDIVIISSDHTRPVPAHIIMPELLRRIRSVNRQAMIRILVATGFHRPPTHEELTLKYGEAIVRDEEIVIHSSRESECISIGTLPGGGDCLINRIAAEADLLISDGFIEAHLFAGFSGGRKAVLPGIASAETIQANHSGAYIADARSRSGILDGNKVHKDMVFAARAARLAFIVNVTLDSEGHVNACFSGDAVEAHEAGCRYLLDRFLIKAGKTDITISSNGGYPLDQNLYQSVKGMTAAEAANREGGIIIMVAGCRDGHGGEAFYNNLISAANPREYYEKASGTPRSETTPEQWGSQILARILTRHTVYLVSTFISEDITGAIGIRVFKTADEALEEAYKVLGADSKVTIIPDGPAVIVE